MSQQKSERQQELFYSHYRSGVSLGYCSSKYVARLVMGSPSLHCSKRADGLGQGFGQVAHFLKAELKSITVKIVV